MVDHLASSGGKLTGINGFSNDFVDRVAKHEGNYQITLLGGRETVGIVSCGLTMLFDVLDQSLKRRIEVRLIAWGGA